MKRAAHLGLLAAVGCSSAAREADLGPCGPRSGTYLLHAVERTGGTCGPVTDQLFHAETSGTRNPGCTTISATETPDHCKETSEVSCGSGKITSSCTWSSSGTEGRCVQTVRNGCTSTYDATLTRQ